MLRDDGCVIRDEALFDSVWQKPQIAVVRSRQLTKTLSAQSIDETLLPDSFMYRDSTNLQKIMMTVKQIYTFFVIQIFTCVQP